MRLEEAVAAYRGALEEMTRARASLPGETNGVKVTFGAMPVREMSVPLTSSGVISD
jgi:hypothetical protein